MLRAIVATVAKRKLLFASAAAYYCTPIRGDERRNKSQQKISKLLVCHCHIVMVPGHLRNATFGTRH